MDFDKYKNGVAYPYHGVDAKAARTAYRENENAIKAQFEIDLFGELGISENPKRDELFRIAWDMGHSGGYSEVYNYALELVGLIK